MIKHTPAPWVLDYGRTIHTNSGTFYLSYGSDKYGNPLFANFCEIDANARLIATAPDLFDFVIQYLYSTTGECTPEHETAPYTDEELANVARDLINKIIKK